MNTLGHKNRVLSGRSILQCSMKRAHALFSSINAFSMSAVMVICLMASLTAPLHGQKYERSASLRYINQLMYKMKPALKRFVKDANLQEKVAFTSLTGVNADITVSEKTYLTTLLERTRFKGYDFSIVPSVEAFNKTEVIGNRYRLNFSTELEDSSRFSKNLNSDYFMTITITYLKRVIAMEMIIYNNEENMKIWSEKVSIFFKKSIVNYELGLLQSVGYDYAIYLSNLLSIDLTTFFKLGLYIAIGASFLNINQNPQSATQLKFIIGLKLAVSLVRPFIKEYKGFDMLFSSKFGVDIAVPVSGAPTPIYNLGSILGTMGFDFFIRGRVSINFDFDIAKLATGATSGVPIASALLFFIEIAYHF
ncbi:hypothetical protein COTS27_01136 [Spirochaetota bacterium]|nr:hypothetical protein COTS27_01136 [Spirochaetota bacterium]